MIDIKQLRPLEFIHKSIHLNFLQNSSSFQESYPTQNGYLTTCKNAHINMSKAADLVTATLEMLQQFRSDNEWNKMHKYIHEVATLCITLLRPQRQRQAPR